MFLNIDIGKFCNFSCAHCTSRSGPHMKNSGFNDIDFLRIRSLLNSNRVKEISFVGGEPTLYIDLINKVLESALNLDELKVQIVTNGWFSNSFLKTSEILSKFIKIDYLVVSIDKFHKETFNSLEERILNLKRYCDPRINFKVEVVIQNLMDLVELKKKINDESLNIKYQHLNRVGRAVDNNLAFKYEQFQPSTLLQSCPQKGSVTYHHNRGFSFCCSNLVYNNVLKDDLMYFKTIEDLYESKYYQLIIKNNFNDILKSIHGTKPDFSPEDSNICSACEKVIRALSCVN